MNFGLIDLHVHTTASDGTMTPAEIVFYAAKRGLKALAITDHDTIDGLSEALEAGQKAGLEVVPGVEIGVDFAGEMHILGYFVDPASPQLTEGLRLLRGFRDGRNPRMVEKLRAQGFDVTMDEVTRMAQGKIVGRPHFAAVLKEKRYVQSIEEAFEKYLGAGKPAYEKKDKLTPRQGIELIISAGGIPVLAHPKYLKVQNDAQLGELVETLAGFGLEGIEAYYTTHTTLDTAKYRRLASDKGLVVTGGTDFHGAHKPDIEIGIGTGALNIRYEILEKLQEKRWGTKHCT